MKTSALEQQFDLYWTAFNGPKLVREYKFHPDRRWKFDFCLPNNKLAIEIEGGVWVQGRHNRGQGFVNDCEKYMEAQLLGWVVYRLPEPLINSKNVERLVRYAKGKHSGLS